MIGATRTSAAGATASLKGAGDVAQMDGAIASFLGIEPAEIPALIATLGETTFSLRDDDWTLAAPASTSALAEVMKFLMKTTAGSSPGVMAIATLFQQARAVKASLKAATADVALVGSDLSKLHALFWVMPPSELRSSSPEQLRSLLSSDRVTGTIHPLLTSLVM